MKSEWLLVEYPCQGGFSEGGRRSHFCGFMVDFVQKDIVDALENKVF